MKQPAAVLPLNIKYILSQPFCQVENKFKQAEIGGAPKKWRESRVGDHIELAYGDGLPERDRKKGAIPVFGSNGITGFHDKALVKGPGIIIGRKGTVGQVAFSKTDFWPIDTTYYVKIKGDDDIVFWYYFLNTLGLNQMNSHSAVPGLNRDNVYEISTLLPSLSEQRAIAKILSDLDEKIELNRQMNKTLESIAQAIFKQWFVDFEPWGGEQPDDWQSYTLGDISVLSAGGDRPKVYSEKPSITCTIPIYSNGIDNDGLYGYTNSAKIIDESVTVSARGTIGFTCLRQVPYFPIVRLISLVPNPRYLSAKYLYLWLKNINISGTGTTQQQLTVPDFKKTEILIPTPEIIKRFTIVADSIFAQITANKNENTTITAIRDSLLPRLMSGKIRVINL